MSERMTIKENKTLETLFSIMSYEDYHKFKSFYMIDYLIKEINLDKIKPEGLPDKDYAILQNLYKALNLTIFYKITSVRTYVKLDNFINEGDLLIIPSIAIIKYLNGSLKDRKFDVYLKEFDATVDYREHFLSFEEEVLKLKNVSHVYGSFLNAKTSSVKINKKYNRIAYVFRNFNADDDGTLYTLYTLPEFYTDIIFALSSLKDGGDLLINRKSGINFPAFEKILQLLTSLFTTVNISTLNGGRSYVLILDKFKESLFDAKALNVKINVPKYKRKYFYGDYRNISIDFPEFSDSSVFDKYVEKNNIASSLALTIENYFIGYYSTINMNYIKYVNDIEHAVDDLIISEVRNFVSFLDKENIPYNKYFTSLLNDYNIKYIKSLYTFSEPITVTLINYSNVKNVIKEDTKSQYPEFDSIVSELFSVKHAREFVIDIYTNPRSRELIEEITEDFTRGINKYITEKFHLKFKASNGFVKMYEILSKFSLAEKNIKSFHMCEAPGQFIKALEYYLEKHGKKLDYLANSLNPKNTENVKKYGKEIIADDYNFIKNNPEKWLYGKDGTGDITKRENIEWFREKISDINLVTGDGGLPYDSPLIDLQRLDYSQLLLTLAVSSVKGDAVLKTFVTFMRGDVDSHRSGAYFVNLIYLYQCYFEEVYLYKPYTSRPSSGEYYIIAKSFKGISKEELEKLYTILDNFTINQTFFSKKDIPKDFIVQLYNFLDKLSRYNIEVIEKLYYFMTCILDEDEKYKEYTGCKEVLKTEVIREKRYNEWIKLFW